MLVTSNTNTNQLSYHVGDIKDKYKYKLSYHVSDIKYKYKYRLSHHVGDIKDNDDPKSPPVAAGQHWTVSLLAPGVPNLKTLDFFIEAWKA